VGAQHQTEREQMCGRWHTLERAFQKELHETPSEIILLLNIGVNKFLARTKFSNLAPNICAFSVSDFLSPRLLRWLLDFWKNFM